MNIEPIVVSVLCLIGWALSLRAGIRIASYHSERRYNRFVIGNALMAFPPLALVIYFAWANSN